MALKRRFLRALITGALAVAAAFAGAVSVAHSGSAVQDSVVVVAHPDDPEGSGGAGNGKP